MKRKRISAKQLRELAERMIRESEEAAALERELDALPPELRPMRGAFAALVSITNPSNLGAPFVAARYAFSATQAQINRSKIRRIK